MQPTKEDVQEEMQKYGIVFDVIPVEDKDTAVPIINNAHFYGDYSADIKHTDMSTINNDMPRTCFSFGQAMTYVENGKCMIRKGWTDQWVEIEEGVYYVCFDAMGKLEFIPTVQDMSAKDWIIR